MLNWIKTLLNSKRGEIVMTKELAYEWLAPKLTTNERKVLDVIYKESGDKIILCVCGNTYEEDLWKGKCPSCDKVNIQEIKRPDMERIKEEIRIFERPSVDNSIDMYNYILVLEDKLKKETQ